MEIQTILERLNFIADEVHDGYSPKQYSKQDIEHMTEESKQLLSKLESSNSSEALTVLIRYLNANHAKTRNLAYELLEQKDPQAVIQVLKPLLESSDLQQLKNVTTSLRNYAGKVEGGIVIARKILNQPLLPDSNPLVAAINESLTERLIELTTHPDWYIRGNCLCVLGFIGMNATLVKPALQAAKQDENEYVREDAQYALTVFNQTQKALKESLSQPKKD